MLQQKPNFLIIQADQVAAQWLPMYGNSVVKMPNLEALAKKGAVFQNAYCNSPLCAPSRFSILSGLLPSKIAAYDNAAEFPSSIPCFTHYLRASGYRTILSGKMHFVGPDGLHGFEERLTTDVYPSDYTWTPDWTHPEKLLEWYHTMTSVVQAGPCVASMDIDYDDDVAFQTVRKLRTLVRDDDERPFCFFVSFTHPHDPYIMTSDYWNLYQDTDIPMPKMPVQPFESLDPHSQRLWTMCATDEFEITPEHIRTARHGYFASLSYIDDKVGQIVKALKDTNQYDNTVIIFTSDHGDMLGERGLWYKMSMVDSSARVPLIFHAPNYVTPNNTKPNNIAPRYSPQVVSLVDLFPTLVELAGFSVPKCDGQSLVPLLNGDTTNVKDQALVEYLAEGVDRPHLMIRQGNYKYIFTEGDPELLFDMTLDPDEMNNLADTETEVLESFRNTLHQTWNVEQLRADVIASQKQRHVVAKALATGKRTAWDFQPFEDASQQYIRNHKEFWELLKLSRYPGVEAAKPVKDIQRFVTAVDGGEKL
jgi:choline-sulfatase